MVCKKNKKKKNLIWTFVNFVGTGKPKVLLNKKCQTYTIYVTSWYSRFKTRFISTMFYVEQTYTNIIIWRELRLQALLSTNSVYGYQLIIKF
jgi:hypothetical protein